MEGGEERRQEGRGEAREGGEGSGRQHTYDGEGGMGAGDEAGQVPLGPPGSASEAAGGRWRRLARVSPQASTAPSTYHMLVF